MTYSDVTRPLLLLLLLMLLSEFRSSEGASMSARFDSEDPQLDLDDLKPLSVALTPPLNALPPDVARLEAESAADAAAIRLEEAKTRQKQRRQKEQTETKHQQRQTQTEDVHEEDKGVEKGKEEEIAGEKETRHWKPRQHGNERHHDSSKEGNKPVAAAAAEHQAGKRVDKTADREDAHITLMKNLGDQFGDEEEEAERQENVKSAASKRPPDLVLEHANDTYTQRYYYVPVAGSRTFPCLPDDVHSPHHAKLPTTRASSFKSVEMAWYNEQGVPLVAPSAGDKKDVRVHVNSANNLTVNDARPENTGRYLCVATATVADDSQITIVNMLRVNVYEYPNYVQLMSYPFELKVACTTSLQDEMIKAAKSGFCPGSDDEPCVFRFTANCVDNNDARDSATATMELTVIKHRHDNLQTPSCSEACVYRTKIRDITSSPIVDRDSVKKIGGYDEKVIRVKQEWLAQRDPWLSLTCGRGHELQNYRCLTCFAGAYQPSDGGGAAVCLLCPVGQYQPHAHSDHCEQCPDEKTTRDEGAVTENDCKSDYLEMIKSVTDSKVFFTVFLVVSVLLIVTCTIVARRKRWWCFGIPMSKDFKSDPSAMSPLLTSSAMPQYFDRLDAGRGRGGASRASSVDPGRATPRPSTIAPSPPPPPSTPSRRLQLAQTRHAAGVGGQQDMQRTLQQNVEMLEAELKRKKMIATAATLAASAANENEDRARAQRPRATTHSPQRPGATASPAVGV